MYATVAGAKTGVPKTVAREFVSADKPGKLPARKTSKLYKSR